MVRERRHQPITQWGPGEAKILGIQDIPPPDTTHWSVGRKALVVAAVDAGLLTITEACVRYRMSAEELHQWQDRLERIGKRGLLITRGSQYRKDEAEKRVGLAGSLPTRR